MYLSYYSDNNPDTLANKRLTESELFLFNELRTDYNTVNKRYTVRYGRWMSIVECKRYYFIVLSRHVPHYLILDTPNIHFTRNFRLKLIDEDVLKHNAISIPKIYWPLFLGYQYMVMGKTSFKKIGGLDVLKRELKIIFPEFSFRNLEIQNQK